MKILILEDEIPAQMQIKRLLAKRYPDYEVLATLGSVVSAAEWLKEHVVDIIFMDVELSDGICFELFNMININSSVIITTAYESYALEAFRVNSIDYLLKPLEEKAFVKAVDRCVKMKDNLTYSQEVVSKIITSSKVYKQRFTVRLGTQIFVVNINDVAYFYAENKSTYIVTKDKKTLLTDLSLEAIEEQLNPETFFKLSRSCIASITSIDHITKYFNSRLKVQLNPPLKEEIFVSRARVPDFMDWLEGNSPS